MAGEIAYKLTAEEKQAVEAIRKVGEALAGVEGGIKKVSEESRRAAQEQAELGRLAKRVMEDAKTPLDRYYEQMKKLDTLVESGKITLSAYEKETKKLRDGLDATQKSFKNVTESQTEAFGRKALEMAKGFLGAIGIETGIAGGVRLIKEEWEAVIKVQERALEASTTIAKAQRKFRTAAGVSSAEEAESFDKQLKDIAKTTGVDDLQLYGDAAAALKNRHGLPKEKAMEAVAAAAEWNPFDSGDRQQMAQAMMGVQQATGMGAKQAGGWLMESAKRTGAPMADIASMLNAAPNQDPKQVMALAQAIGVTTQGDPTKPVLGLMRGLEGLPAEAGTTIQEKMAYVRKHTGPAYTQGQYDTEKTKLDEDKAAADAARINEDEQRKLERTREARQNRRNARQRQEDNERYITEDAERTRARDAQTKAFAKRHEELEKRKATIGVDYTQGLVKEMSLRGPKAKAAVEQILRGEGPAYAEYTKDLGAAMSPAEGEAAFGKATAIGGAGPQQATALFEQKLDDAKRGIESADEMQPAARMAAIAKHFRPILEDVGQLSLLSKLTEFGVRLSPDQIKAAKEAIEQKQTKLRHPTSHVGGGFSTQSVPRAPTETESAQAEQLQPVIDAISDVMQSSKPSPRPGGGNVPASRASMHDMGALQEMSNRAQRAGGFGFGGPTMPRLEDLTNPNAVPAAVGGGFGFGGPTMPNLNNLATRNNARQTRTMVDAANADAASVLPNNTLADAVKELAEAQKRSADLQKRSNEMQEQLLSETKRANEDRARSKSPSLGNPRGDPGDRT